jgi:hypothetical protein
VFILPRARIDDKKPIKSKDFIGFFDKAMTAI